MKYDHIFVLSPGRSGSKSFAEACKYLTNYTSAHESRSGKVGEDRFNFPLSHIEADNRLTWFLGAMAERFDSKNVLYVHLSRDFNQTVDSFVHRLQNSDYRSSIIHAFAHGILMKPGDWKPEEEVELCRLYVQTIHSNIKEFLKQRVHMNVQLGDDGASFNRFLVSISPQGDIDLVKRTWLEVHNAR